MCFCFRFCLICFLFLKMKVQAPDKSKPSLCSAHHKLHVLPAMLLTEGLFLLRKQHSEAQCDGHVIKVHTILSLLVFINYICLPHVLCVRPSPSGH